MAKRRGNVSFRTTRQSNGSETKRFAVVLVACVLAVLTVSLIVIFISHDFDMHSAIGIDIQTESTQTTAEETVIEGEKTLLLWCADDSGKELEAAWIVNFRLPERRATICALDISENITVASDEQLNYQKSETVANLFSRCARNEFTEYIEDHFGIETDGYIGSQAGEFKAMVNYFGGFDVTVPEQIEHKSSEMNLILIKGKQNIKGDTLYKYVCYLASLGEKGRKQLSSLMGEVLDGVFKASNAGRCGNIFAKISNSLETDLSIVNFTTAEQGIVFLCENGFASKKLCDSPDEIKRR